MNLNFFLNQISSYIIRVKASSFYHFRWKHALLLKNEDLSTWSLFHIIPIFVFLWGNFKGMILQQFRLDMKAAEKEGKRLIFLE